MKFAAAFILVFATQTFAIPVKNPLLPNLQFSCDIALKGQHEAGPIEFHTSGRDNILEGKLRTDAQIVTDIAHKLGLATPPHKFYFVPDEQLNVMAALGGQPTPTWMDGHNIATSMGRVMGVLEFVTPGCPTCRSYYSDKSTLEEQRSILMHVMGHNDMANTSRLIIDRHLDPPRDGMLLANKIAEAYEKFDHDEVSQFVQQLHSLDNLQDYTFAAVERPENFLPDSERGKMTDPVQWAETANVLQAMTHRLDQRAPAWKKEIFELYEKVHRVYPAYSNTKIMNEGWATMQQYLIARHAPWTTSRDIIEYAALMAGVAYPKLDNPYWLGLMAWQNLYIQFTRRVEIKGLPEIEKDKAFIAWARTTYQSMTDYEFLQMGIDQEFTDRWNLFLYRKTLREEMTPGVPPEKQAYIALTRDAVRIRQYMIRKMADRSLSAPRILIENPELHDPAKITLRQELQHGLPLNPASVAQTLFVMTQVFQKPAVLKGFFQGKYGSAGGDFVEQLVKYYLELFPGQEKEIRAWVETMDAETLRTLAQNLGLTEATELVEIAIQVNPDGTVTAEDLSGQKLSALAEGLTQVVAAYQDDLLMSLSPEMNAAQKQQWQKQVMALADEMTNPSMEVVQYAPYAGQALQELIQMMEWRMPAAFQKALNNGGLTPSKKGVKMKVLPSMPSIQFDYEFYNRKWSRKPVGPVDSRVKTGGVEWGIDDNGTQLSASQYLPGDKFAGPQKGKGKGKGEGDPDEEGDGDGDPEDNDGDEPQPGQGGSDATDIEIPLALYGEMLAKELELPNLRRTEAESEKTRPVLNGKIHKPNGQLLWHEIAIEAMHIANAIRKSKGQPYGAKVNPYILIREGMAFIDTSNYVVRDRHLEPVPDFDAVLVINVDVTGSMMGERVKMAKNLIFNIKALLSAVYKNVKIHYVAFDSTAEEVSEEKVWTIWKGGGTAYAPALVEDQRILEKYPTSRYNRYVLTIGDGETADGDQFVAELQKMAKDLQYAGVAITTNGGWNGHENFINQVNAFKGTWPWVGTTVMTDLSQTMRAIKDLFPKGKKAKDN